MQNINLRFSEVSFSYDTSIENIFSDINISFNTGWTGIVGPNGIGKTTLAKLAIGLLNPTSGTIIKSKGSLSTFYCEQTTEYLPEFALDFFSDTGNESGYIKSILKINSDRINNWNTLSHGERKRIQIGIMLWKNHDIVVLDEPTNHLDHETVSTLYQGLKDFNGIGIIISHDRFLLDKLCSNCLFVEKDSITMRKGGITVGMEQRQLDIKTKIANYKNCSDKYSKLSKSINKHKELLSSKKNLLSKKGIAKKDHSKKNQIDLARLSGKDKPLSQKVKSLDTKLEETKQQMENLYFHERYISNFVFQGERAKCNFLFKFDNINIQVCENITLKSPELIIKPEDKIAITGSNGVGKSLLVKYIYKTIKIEPSKILYIPQEFDSEEINNIKLELQTLNRTDLGKLYTIIFRLGSEPDRLLHFETPSPGEIRKIIFGLGILKQPQIIIMDEPTNHLDLPSIEKLEETLCDFVGALLLVSHDLTFIKKLTTIEWNIAKSNNMSELTIV